MIELIELKAKEDEEEYFLVVTFLYIHGLQVM